MLRSPRRLPQRYNRRVTPQTRGLAQRRYQRRRQFMAKRMQHLWHRLNRKGEVIRTFIVRFVMWVGLGAFALVMAVLFFSPLLEVREVRIARTDARIDIERVQRLLKPLFGRHLLFLSSQEVLPLLEDGIAATATVPAQPGMKDLATVEVVKRYPSTLLLKLQLDPLIARLQISQTSDAKAATGSLTADFLTADGVYVAYSPDQVNSGAVLPLLKIVDWKEQPQPFDPLLTEEFLKVMRNAEKALSEQFGQQVRSRTVYLRGQEFHLLTPEYSLWFDLKSPLEMQLLRYRLFLQTLGKGSAKQYVDLRLTDRVVYK
jgi:hypothetical protein